ncbi:MAG TPA: hypothetical protein VGJ77_19325 [Gaiellaceae bacterium]|jgi:aromatic ring-opening dioxygenase LigB subunit
MTVVFAAIAPHGGPVFDLPESPTRKAMEELGRRFAAARPDAVVVLTPHGAHVDGHFTVVRSARLEGDASQWTEADTRLATDGDPELADACVRALQADGLPALGVTFGATAAGASTMPLDWGALIPLWFMRAPAVVVTPTRERPPRDQIRAGTALARATGDRRVALIASADHGHGHTADGPYGYTAESAPYDERIVDIVRRNRLDELLDVEESFVHAALADSWWQLLMLHGALGDGFAAELLSYEVPTYFGMLCASFSPRAG